MLACLARPERPVADAALDYLINLNTIPVAKRAPQLRADVYASALPLMLRHVSASGGATRVAVRCCVVGWLVAAVADGVRLGVIMLAACGYAQAQYPADFTTWEDEEEDEDTFTRCVAL